MGVLRGNFLASTRGEERESRVCRILCAAVDDRRGAGPAREEVGGASGCGLALTVTCTGANCQGGSVGETQWFSALLLFHARKIREMWVWSYHGRAGRSASSLYTAQSLSRCGSTE